MARQVMLLALVLLVIHGSDSWAASPISIHGKVIAKEGPLEGAYVGAHANGKLVTTYVMTDKSGRFTFRGLASGTYAVFTQIPGFRKARKDGITAQSGKEAVVNFQVEPETDFLKLVEQASNSELTDSFPISREQREALDFRCADCHGVSYIAKSRFSLKDWKMIIDAMDDQGRITPAADISPPPRMSRPSQRDPKEGPSGSDDDSLAEILAQFRGAESPDFPIKFQPRAMGEMTRAIVSEYQIQRLGAAPRTVAIDPRGRHVWYSDWRANFLGRVDIETGEIKEYAIPGRDDRPPGLQRIGWDPLGNLWAGQIWTGRAVRFDVRREMISGIFAPPQDWVRAGGVGICTQVDGSVIYSVGDALVGTRWTLNPETGTFTEIAGDSSSIAECEDQGPWSNSSGRGTAGRSIAYQDPATGKRRVFPMTTPWSRPYNVVGDPVRKVGWTAPDVSDRIVKADLTTGKVTEYPLPSRGKEIRNIDIEMSANPPALWFVNQRLGRIVRFQEYSE